MCVCGGVNSFLFLLTDGLLCVCVGGRGGGGGGGASLFSARFSSLLFLLFHLMHKWPGQIEIFMVDIKDIGFFLLNSSLFAQLHTTRFPTCGRVGRHLALNSNGMSEFDLEFKTKVHDVNIALPAMPCLSTAITFVCVIFELRALFVDKRYISALF